jgi:DNA replication protein DnaC
MAASGRLLSRLSRIDVLVIDDWAMAPVSEPERRDLREICEDRYQVRSAILTSQLPVSRWNEQIADPPLPTAFSTGWSTMPTESKCVVIRCARMA